MDTPPKISEDEVEKEQGRWQEAIYQLLSKMFPNANIDGKGCDSGDPLDFTISEIKQGLAIADEQTAQLKVENERLKELDLSADNLIETARAQRDELEVENKVLRLSLAQKDEALKEAKIALRQAEFVFNDMRQQKSTICPDYPTGIAYINVVNALQSINSSLSTPTPDTAILKQFEGMRAALEKLACLGNGDKYGNSDGNIIAQDALKLLNPTKEGEK